MTEKWNERIQNVTWGYRDKFSRALKNICENDKLDPSAATVFDKAFMRIAGRDYCTDNAANHFLDSLSQNMNWILSYPALFEAWTQYGLKLLDTKLFLAVRYFELWNREGCVKYPEEMQTFLVLMKRVEDSCGIRAALAFLEGYPEIAMELSPDRIERFVHEGTCMFAEKPNTAEKFFRLELASSRKLVEIISRRCCLKDVKPRIQRLFKGILNSEVDVGDTSSLDSDELIEKGSTTVCFRSAVYLPARVTAYSSHRLNRDWYMAAAYANAFSLLFDGFPSVHALPGFESMEDFLNNSGEPSDRISQNIFYLMDVYRIFMHAFMLFPGTKQVIRRVLESEINHREDLCVFDSALLSLFGKVVEDSAVRDFCQVLSSICRGLNSFHEVAGKLSDVRSRFVELAEEKYCKWSGRLSFLSDYSYRTGMSEPAGRKLLTAEKRGHNRDKSENKGKEGTKNTGTSCSEGSNEKQTSVKSAQYVYDEWNSESGEYMYEWCSLNEFDGFHGAAGDGKSIAKPGDVQSIRRVFEKFKPDTIRRQKYVQEGDELLLDGIVDFTAQRKAGLLPEPRVYSRSIKDERDIAVALLLDASGSTAEERYNANVIETEKNAAFLLAEGLSVLDDTFGVFGFSGFGRANCQYFVFKDFDNDWDSDSKSKLAACRAAGSTRTGVAVRHTAFRMEQLENRRKLVMVITDGKPQDSDGYTTEGYYAQNDVHMACVEAKAKGINVFCISVGNNSLYEMDLMFPAKRYIIAKDVSELPRLLTANYIRLT